MVQVQVWACGFS